MTNYQASTTRSGKIPPPQTQQPNWRPRRNRETPKRARHPEAENESAAPLNQLPTTVMQEQEGNLLLRGRAKREKTEGKTGKIGEVEKATEAHDIEITGRRRRNGKNTVAPRKSQLTRNEVAKSETRNATSKSAKLWLRKVNTHRVEFLSLDIVQFLQCQLERMSAFSAMPF